jgi:N-acylneuraminate cytidylyltransferase
MSTNLAAIIPAKRIDTILNDKNTLPFNNTNLLIHKIHQLQMVNDVSQIIVSSEDDYILEMATKEGVVALKRSIEYANGEKTFSEFVEYIASQVDTRHILWSCVTSPLVGQKLYQAAINKYYEILPQGYDSLISVLKFQQYVLDKIGSVNFKIGNKHVEHGKLPELYLFTNGFTLAQKKDVIKWKYLWGILPFRFEVTKHEAIDIKDIYDYESAVAIWDKYHEKI